MTRYSIDTARDSQDWYRVHYIVRDNETGAVRGFDTIAEAEEVVKNDTIDRILAEIDRDATAGWCSNWADYTVHGTTLIVTLADDTKDAYFVGATR